MRILKAIVLAAAAALLFVSCVPKTTPESIPGNYSVTCDKTVSLNSGSGIIYSTMYDEVAKLANELKFRTDANDKKVIAVTDKVAAEYKNQASEKIKISVIFTESNQSGKPENKPVVIKSYDFIPVD